MMGTSKDSMKEMIVLSFSLCRSSKGYGSFHIDKGKEKKQKNHYLYDSDYACTRSGTVTIYILHFRKSLFFRVKCLYYTFLH